VESIINGFSYFRDRLHAVNVVEDVRVSFIVEVDDRHGLVSEGSETGSKGFSGIIFTVHERLSGDIIDSFDLRRAGGQVVRATGSGVDSASFNSISEDLFINLKVEDFVDSLVARSHQIFKGFGLSSSSGESIEQNSTFAHGLVHVIVDKSNYDLIGYKFSRIYNRFGLLS
jgi:hypothetical protein